MVNGEAVNEVRPTVFPWFKSLPSHCCEALLRAEQSARGDLNEASRSPDARGVPERLDVVQIPSLALLAHAGPRRQCGKIHGTRPTEREASLRTASTP